MAIVGPREKWGRALFKFKKKSFKVIKNRYAHLALCSSFLTLSSYQVLSSVAEAFSNPNEGKKLIFAGSINGLCILFWSFKIYKVGQGLDFLNWKKNKERISILDACEKGDMATLEAYHQKKSNSNWDWKGYSTSSIKDITFASLTPIEAAAYHGQWKVMDWLIAHGAKAKIPGIEQFEELKSISDEDSKFEEKLFENGPGYFILFFGNRFSFQKMLEQEHHNSNMSPTVGLYYLFKRASQNDDKANEAVDIFEELKPLLFPLESIKKALEEIKVLDKSVLEDEGSQFLLYTLNSYIEQDELNKKMMKAQKETSSSSFTVSSSKRL